jgi:hypothetical protein
LTEHSESKFGMWQVGYVSDSFQTELDTTLAQNHDRMRRVGLINENKFSLVPGELYGLRARVIRDSRFWAEPLQVAGKNWTRGLVWTLAKQLGAFLEVIKAGLTPDVSRLRFPIGKTAARFLGRVESEIDFLRSLEIALVIENEPSYVSEKLTNAMIAGCQIVYVGPSLDLDNCCSVFIYECKPSSDAIAVAVQTLLQKPLPARDAFLEHLKTCNFLGSWLIRERTASLATLIEKWTN